MSEDKELLVNLRNRQRAEVPLSEQAAVVRSGSLVDASWEQRQREQRQRVQGALARLKAKAVTDEILADLLTVLGL